MRIVFLLMILLSGFIKVSKAQTIPFGYDSVTTLIAPTDSINDAAGCILLSKDEKMIAVQYSYNPTYIYFYEVGTWKVLKVVKLKGHNFIYNSYYSDDSKYFYTTASCQFCKPMRINVETGEVDKVSCKELPKGCDYTTTLKTGERIFTEDDLYLLVISGSPDYKVQVWKKSN